RPLSPRWIENVVLSHTWTYDSMSTFVQTRAATTPASSTAELPVSVRRKVRSGVSRFRTHAVRPENPGSVVAAASTWSPTLIARPAYACASRLRRKRVHDRVDDLVRVLVVERRAAEEEAVEQRSDEHLVCESHVGVGTEVAARDAAVDDRLYLCEPEI